MQKVDDAWRQASGVKREALDGNGSFPCSRRVGTVECGGGDEGRGGEHAVAADRYPTFSFALIEVGDEAEWSRSGLEPARVVYDH